MLATGKALVHGATGPCYQITVSPLGDGEEEDPDDASQAARLGGAVQVTPGRPQVDPAWFQRLNLPYDKLLSNVAFNCNLRPSASASCSRTLRGIRTSRPCSSAAPSRQGGSHIPLWLILSMYSKMISIEELSRR